MHSASYNKVTGVHSSSFCLGQNANNKHNKQTIQQLQQVLKADGRIAQQFPSNVNVLFMFKEVAFVRFWSFLSVCKLIAGSYSFLQILTNVSLTTADANTSVRTYLGITRVTVYLGMTSTVTANHASVYCTLICHTLNRNARTRLSFCQRSACNFNRLIYFCWHLYFMSRWIHTAKVQLSAVH